MIAMAKLTLSEWANARARWERSVKDGFEWLAKELGVDRSVISRRAKSESWCKKSTEKDTHRAKKDTQKSTGVLNVANRENIDESSLNTTRKYKPEYNGIAYNLALSGFTLEEIALILGIHLDTLTEWRKKHDDFETSILNGRELADSEVVRSLYDVATGRRLIIEKKEVLNSITGEIVTLTNTRTALPDVKAIIHWLFNRDKIKQYWNNGEGKNAELSIEIDAKEVIDAFNEAMEKAREKYNTVLDNRRGVTIDNESGIMLDD